MLVCQHDASPHHQQWRHNIHKQERREARKFQPPSTQDQTRPSFCAAAAAAASNVGKLKKGRTPNSLQRFSYTLECLATDERVSLRGVQLQTQHTQIHLLTYSMVQSPSWGANWFAASQEITRILWNPKVRYRTHKRPPPVPILGQSNSVHIPTSNLLEIHPNIIRPSTPRSPQWPLSLRFPHQDPIRPPLLTHTRHMPSPSHSRFYHPHNIGCGVKFITVSKYFLKFFP